MPLELSDECFAFAPPYRRFGPRVICVPTSWQDLAFQQLLSRWRLGWIEWATGVLDPFDCEIIGPVLCAYRCWEQTAKAAFAASAGVVHDT